MSPRARRSYGSKRPSRAYKAAALQLVLVQRADLDSLSVDSLARSYGFKPAEVEHAISEEKRRRAFAA